MVSVFVVKLAINYVPRGMLRVSFATWNGYTQQKPML